MFEECNYCKPKSSTIYNLTQEPVLLCIDESSAKLNIDFNRIVLSHEVAV